MKIVVSLYWVSIVALAILSIAIFQSMLNHSELFTDALIAWIDQFGFVSAFVVLSASNRFLRAFGIAAFVSGVLCLMVGGVAIYELLKMGGGSFIARAAIAVVIFFDSALVVISPISGRNDAGSSTNQMGRG